MSAFCIRCVVGLVFAVLAVLNFAFANQVKYPGLITAIAEVQLDKQQAHNRVDGKFLSLQAAQAQAKRLLVKKVSDLGFDHNQLIGEIRQQSVLTQLNAVLQSAFVIESKFNELEQSYSAQVTLAICLNAYANLCKQQPDLNLTLLLENYSADTTTRAQVAQLPQAIQRAFIFVVRQKHYQAALLTRFYSQTGGLVMSSHELLEQPHKFLLWDTSRQNFSQFKPRMIEVLAVKERSDLVVSELDAAAIIANLKQTQIDGLFVVVKE